MSLMRMPTDLVQGLGNRGRSGQDPELHTGVWHGDRVFDLQVPVDWQVTAFWPARTAHLTDGQIAACLARPAGQEAISAACAGKTRPLIVVDSTTRPTPVAALLPHILHQFRLAGIDSGAVRILVATGIEGAPRPESLIKKLGPAAARCQALIHDPDRDTADLGTIAPRVRLLVNREVVLSDYVLGVEGLYPAANGTYPAGSRLACDVLGRETIRQLAARFPEAGDDSAEEEWQTVVDLIAERIHLHSMLTAQVDASRNLVRLACGEPEFYYPRELAFARATFGAPLPGDADVVVANAYPADLTLASALGAAAEPLRQAPRNASRILLASCTEGAGPGTHTRPSWWQSMMALARLRSAAAERFCRPRPAQPAIAHQHPVWLYRPGPFAEPVPARIGDVRLAPSWEFVVNRVAREQSGRTFRRVYLYPCAPLQLLGPGR